MKLEFSRQVLAQYSNTKFHENPWSSSRVVPHRRTDRVTEMAKLILVLPSFAKPLKIGILSNGGALLKCVRNVSLATDINPASRWFPVAFQSSRETVLWPVTNDEWKGSTELTFCSRRLVLLPYVKKDLQWSVSNMELGRLFSSISLKVIIWFITIKSCNLKKKPA
jgi:hypothetical protein